MEFEEVVRRRRIVRRFSGESVSPEVVDRIAAIAQRAPSAGFSQGQRLVVVTDEAVRRRVGLIAGDEEYEAMGFGRWVSEGGALFIPCVSERVYLDRYAEPDKRNPDGSVIDWPIPYWWMDIGCTVMLILLAAVDAGLAAGFTGGDPDELRAELGIPDDYAPVGIIPVGHPLPDKRSPSLRRGWVPSEDFVHRNAW
jgi:nitroreductase